ncbi:hypothetical protein CR513_49545, partial [Mucuna pruriens]
MGNILLKSDVVWAKECGVTYQWAMLTLFNDIMHKKFEVYVDDMIAKSKISEQDIAHLLQKYKLRLHPAKCTFRVKSGRLLDFIVNERGIKVDMNKIKLIQEMPTSKTEFEIRGALGSYTSSTGKTIHTIYNYIGGIHGVRLRTT